LVRTAVSELPVIGAKGECGWLGAANSTTGNSSHSPVLPGELADKRYFQVQFIEHSYTGIFWKSLSNLSH
jgi:hypothetical protein